MIDRDSYIKRKMELMCRICYRKLRIEESMRRELPEQDTLDELERVFNNILKRES